MRRPGITAKLFLAILGVTLCVVVLMTFAVQVTFRSDFLDYVREREGERIAVLASVLADYYREAGDWEDLSEPRRWRHLVREALWRQRKAEADHREREEGAHREGDGGDDDDDDDDDHDGSRHLFAGPGGDVPAMQGPVRFGPALLDADRRHVAGPKVVSGQTESRPVVVDGATVGWLVYRPPGRITDELALRFQEKQFHAAWMTALVVVVLATVVSLLLARGFLAPVRRLAGGTRALTAGRFDTRVDESRRDELGQLANDFNRLAETLERNERLRRAFMADISHELRTPLSVLRAELEAMEDGVRPLTRESLTGLQGSVATLSKLVDDLYELSLADAGALNYRMEALDLAALARASAEQWRPRMADAGLTLTVQVPEAPVTVTADRGRVNQLLGNLLHNSLCYTDRDGEVRLSLTTRDGEAVLRLEDSAPGVPAEALERLFERLYRVEGSRSRSSGGAGLGLAICRNIVEAHGGRIEAYPSPAGGVGIRLTLPLADRVNGAGQTGRVSGA
ncbi:MULTISPECIES: ATP-binding protein [Halomonas]|uniref:histidine kinase n=1 Tax=Halomonas ventosae TaxID=229007 RepID=A0A4R6I3G3_9GAMM|nr:ATP-binding protein [Halomonas ventosae]TDO15285.1 two-component system sensor histidine kinase BaeS [Halomonas ventosae]